MRYRIKANTRSFEVLNLCSSQSTSSKVYTRLNPDIYISSYRIMVSTTAPQVVNWSSILHKSTNLFDEMQTCRLE